MSIKCLNDSSFPSFSASIFHSSSVTKINNICLETYTTRNGVLSKFKLSRKAFRKYALNGSLFGCKKSIW